MEALAERIRMIIAREEPRLRAITPAAAVAPRASGKWCIAQILGHLVDSAANNHQRFVRGQLVDRLTFPGYAQNEWVSVQDYAREPWGDLIGLWVALNQHLAHVVEGIPAAARTHGCIILAADGTPGPSMSLEALVADYLLHKEHHLTQI